MGKEEKSPDKCTYAEYINTFTWSLSFITTELSTQQTSPTP